MRRHLPVDDSSEESEYADSDLDVNLTDDETCSNEDGRQGEQAEDQAWLFADKGHPPQHYTSMLETFDEREYTEDYKESSTRLLDRIEH